MVELCWGGSLVQRWGVNVGVESHFSLFAPETVELNSNFIGQMVEKQCLLQRYQIH